MAIKFNQSIQSLFQARYRKIDYFVNHPVEQQKKVLFNLLDTAKKTKFGRDHNFSGINNRYDFSKSMPINRYDDIKPYIERMISGEKDVLWPGKVKWFAKSSGTTSDKSKFIPVSKESLYKCHYRASLDVFALYMRINPAGKILKGKSLTIGGSHKVSHLNKSTRTGDLSAVMLQNMPRITRLRSFPPTDISLLPDFEEKIEKIAMASIDENIKGFAGVPSWFLVLIKRVLDITGKDNLLDVWPGLEVFVHGGINFDPYREQYNKLIPTDDMYYVNTYNASEGFFGIQNDISSDDMLLMLDYGIYFEFIPMDSLHKDKPDIVTIEDVKTGVNYALLISTNGGLWRYLIGDTVLFTSTNPLKIKITGRTKQFINAFGEELIVDNAEKALKVVCNETGAIIQEYTAGPMFMSRESKGAHQWIVEFQKKPESTELFARRLDEELQKLNSDYEAKRYKNLNLESLKLVDAPQKTFYEWMKKRGKIGGQNKIPRLANDRKYLEQVLEIIEEIK